MKFGILTSYIGIDSVSAIPGLDLLVNWAAAAVLAAGSAGELQLAADSMGLELECIRGPGL